MKPHHLIWPIIVLVLGLLIRSLAQPTCLHLRLVAGPVLTKQPTNIYGRPALQMWTGIEGKTNLTDPQWTILFWTQEADVTVPLTGGYHFFTFTNIFE